MLENWVPGAFADMFDSKNKHKKAAENPVTEPQAPEATLPEAPEEQAPQ